MDDDQLGGGLRLRPSHETRPCLILSELYDFAQLAMTSRWLVTGDKDFDVRVEHDDVVREDD